MAYSRLRRNAFCGRLRRVPGLTRQSGAAWVSIDSHHEAMNKIGRTLAGMILLRATGALQSSAVELRVSREALEPTLNQQLVSGPERTSLSERERTACPCTQKAALGDDCPGPERGEGQDKATDGK